MRAEIKVPAMGESISSATVGNILKPSGSQVEADEEILELETEKVNQVLYAPQAGIITLTVASHEVVQIGQLLGYVESQEGATKEPAKEAPREPPKEPPKEAPKEPPKTPKEPAKESPKEPAKEAVSVPEGAARYTKEAFLAEVRGPKLKEEKPVGERRETRRKMSKVRRVIAERLVQVQQATASLTTFNEVDMSQILLLRERYKEAFVKQHGVKLGFMSFFVKATLLALEAFPDFNSYLEGDEIVHREYYDIGVAVGTERGLFVPVIRNCDQLTYPQIELAIANYATKAKEGKLAADDLQGGGFTITNGGVYGSLLSTPILNPPQCAILGMHKIEKRAVVVDDQIVIRPMMYLALTYDHRLVDGKEAVSFLVHMKNSLEDPARQVLHV
jgi:2-oxoglutarate dehydrogenase E2 component (dihydrolipoamide succinyltransferase)